MADRIVYVSRLLRLPLIAPDGTDVSRIVDVVIGTSVAGEAPRVNGFVVTGQHRRVFVGAGRVGEIAPEGVRLRYGTINVR